MSLEHPSDRSEPPATARPTAIETRIPADTEPAAVCPFCQRPFPTDRLCSLHLGEQHPELLDAALSDRVETAVDTESDELFVYHLKIIVAFVATFFGFTYVYVFVWI